MTAPVWQPIPRGDIPRYETVMEYVEHYAARTPDAVAVSDLDGASITYGRLPAAVRGLQKGLLDGRVGPGDVVATLAPPSVDHWLTFLAAVDLGALWLGLNPRYRLEEWRGIFAVARPKALYARQQIGQRDYTADLAALTEEFGTLRLPLDPPPADTPTGGDAAPDEPALLVFTSGSTGKPKGVLLRQSGLLACARIQAHHYGQWGGAVLNSLPINHVGCIVDIGLTALVTGGTQVFVEDFLPQTFLDALTRTKASLLGGVPAMLLYLMEKPEFWSTDLSHVRRILWSGGHMPKNAAMLLATLGKPMHNFYGMTETTGSFTFTRPDADIDHLVDTVGLPDPGWQVRIADPATGVRTPDGSAGEIQVRGPGVMHSYLGDPQASADAFTEDGYFKTSDLGVRNADGSISLAGRLRDVFKSGGYNVFPRQVEEALEALPNVVMAAVVAAPDDTLGEVGIAFLTLLPGTDLDEDDVRNALKTTLASYKVPKRFILMDEPPLLPNGKLNRRALAATAVGSKRP
ncbi:class I adenylate-forming enzyme family protein [Kitasatospora cineracea]|uniref:Long-chain acyl-CoA synthetase n=1 Tax=Kitasatospora cineracea TaxID=88074 RepID=A0A8G1URR8_9ACTN|nr:class I adenylate-forming enzyme family protein [Kitasatospora cineracea]ROR46562.1 long-chain acyl-CoA synthetase [Kitasatospora cineracea]